MSSAPIICFGQQPCGFFPKRFLVAKILTARRLQSELGGEIVFFYHDADHDFRETKTTLRHRRFGDLADFNFDFDNKLQRKYSPLYLKRVQPKWHQHTLRQLPNYVPPPLIDLFKNAFNPPPFAPQTPPVPTLVADFCLDIYQQMKTPDGRPLFDGIRIVRSSNPILRLHASDIPDYFVDTPYENEIVRARMIEGTLKLHEGGDHYLPIPSPPTITKAMISPTRDTRLRWMQSLLHCTHYIAGMGEQAYLNKSEASEITFLNRDPIDRLEEAWTEIS